MGERVLTFVPTLFSQGGTYAARPTTMLQANIAVGDRVKTVGHDPGQDYNSLTIWAIRKFSFLYFLTTLGIAICISIGAYIPQTLLQIVEATPHGLVICVNGVGAFFSLRHARSSPPSELEEQESKFVAGCCGRCSALGFNCARRSS